ncbi:AAA family ATPase [Streptomyces sp. SCA3-4]|uniref:AAA family ATPase n=1 Tax=Streptomyces sichuanensis TaxID=2871810 RepID=UPI001CE28799|nr:LuxR family transcriptional regulator [Streptomyces sichuanensis]MCA6094247.1 AAA family ATPase [Streptomyces sichuanensis]
MTPQVTDERPPRRPPAPPTAAPLVERDAEQRLLTTLLTSLHAGRPALAEVHGAPGTGRSALLERAAELARDAGVRVAAAQASWEETRLRYGVAAQLTTAIAPTGIGLPLAPGQDDADHTATLCHAFLTAARTHPLMVVIDDVQWADPHSLRWLRALARRLPGTPLMLLTARSGATPAGPDDHLRPRAVDDGTAVTRHTLRLAPLSADGVDAVLTATLGTPADPAFRDAAARATDGNPAVLHAVAGRFARHGWTPRADHLPRLDDSTVEAIRERAARTLTTLPKELLDVLRAVAVCGREATCDMLGAVAAPRTVGTRRALELLSGTGLLTGGDRPAFRDPRAADAVLARMSSDRREELYARAAEHAHRAALPDATLAGMLLGARVLGAAWAVDVLRREAARHRATRRPAEAARLLQRALREPMAPQLRVRTLTELAAAVLPSAPEAADRHLRQALLTPADATAGPAWVRAADLLVARGDVAAAQPLIAHLATRNRLRDPEHGALRALYWLSEHVQPDTTHPLDRPPVPALADRPAHPAEAAVAAWRAALSGHDITRTRELARAALAPAAADTTPLAAQATACHALVLTGDFAEAHAGLDTVLLRAEHADARAVAGATLVTTALARLHEGRPAEASTALDRAQELMPPHCWHPSTTSLLVALKTLIFLQKGDLDHAERSIGLAREGCAEGSIGWAYLLFARGRTHLATGHRDRALADLLECGRLLLTRQVANPALLPWRSAAAQARGNDPNDPSAAFLMAEERRLALAWGAPYAVARTLLATGDPGAPADPAAPAGWQYRQALTALATAPLSSTDTVAPLLRSRAPAADGPAGPGRPERPATGDAPATDRGPAPRGGLTGAELRVANLAVQGLANRTIAAELSVTPRTVELHLTKVYRKLGIQGRPELADALGRAPREKS